MPLTTHSQQEAISHQGSSANGAGSTGGAAAASGTETSRRKVANRADAQKSTGPRTRRGLERVARNLPAASPGRLLGLAESRVLKQEPGAVKRQDQWINMQGGRLRRAVDRNKRLLPKLLQTLNLNLAEAGPVMGEGRRHKAKRDKKKIA